MSEAYVPHFRMTDDVTNLISEISELLGILSVDAHWAADPLVRQEHRIRTIHATLALEQNVLSPDQVAAVMEGKRVLGPPRDIQEARNAIEAYERMAALHPLSLEDLLATHRLMMRELIPDAGRFRSSNLEVYDGDQPITVGTPARYVPDAMRQLFHWLVVTSMHPLIKGAMFHFDFELIHPFSDGNGRTSRLWHSLILQQWRPILGGLPVESKVYEHQGDYHQVLDGGLRRGEATDFIVFMLWMLRDTLRGVLEGQQAAVTGHVVDAVVNHVTPKVQNVVDNVVNTAGQAPRQADSAVLDIVKRRPRSSAREIGELIGLSTRQIQRVMAGLQAQGLLIRRGSPRNGYWEIIEQQ